ncbi:HMA2 domain-containing protein [Treponema socranskii]|uniref:HMA2 domain-containing protein n=1 Tax=Treponema socranskii TaxID=53419 RepID=UPI003D93AEA7
MMQINYFPGRLRLRDPALRDEAIRSAALDVLHSICPAADPKYNEKTGSVLITYDPDGVPLERLQTLVPVLKKLRQKLASYSEKNRGDILSDIAQIKSIVDSWSGSA